MNPYDFARIDWSKPPERHKPTWHHKLVKADTRLFSGSLDMDIYAETPLFIANSGVAPTDPTRPAQSMQNQQGAFIIPGSSLKGMVRSVVETLGNGCLTLYDGEYEGHRVHYQERVLKSFQPCRDATNLCLACRTFGMLKGGDIFLGKVNIGDAVSYPDKAYKYDPLYTAVLVEPKPRHEEFYLDEKKQHISGRKFYFHHSPGQLLTEKQLIYFGRNQILANRYIQPLDIESSFHFRVDFTNLEPDEFGVLLLALTLEDEMRHKIGYGKPMGLGSVELRPLRLTLVDYSTRYTSYGQPGAKGGKTLYEGDTIWTEVLYEHIDTFIEQHLSRIAMDDLSRIWRWSPDPNADYYYPSKRDWFDTPASRGKRIADTWDVPG
ncbi:MAG: RAMP superfamily CRISPR-associated protein [Ktedonobacteraceae bacterium]